MTTKTNVVFDDDRLNRVFEAFTTLEAGFIELLLAKIFGKRSYQIDVNLSEGLLVIVLVSSWRGKAYFLDYQVKHISPSALDSMIEKRKKTI